MKTQNSAQDIVFLSAVRTPFGTFGGALRDMPVVDLTVHAAKAAIERAGIAPSDVDSTTLGDVKVCLVGGADSMSQAPHVARGLRWGVPLGKSAPLDDSLWEALRDSYVNLSMAETAENLAKRYDLSRQCVDEYALRSQQLAAQAWSDGAFANEVVGVPVKNPK